MRALVVEEFGRSTAVASMIGRIRTQARAKC
jgi:hypothetical protein